jgi:putative ABC transport system permease protein
MWWVVIGYVFLMVLLASYESSARSKYYLDGQFWMVLFPMITMIAFVSLFAFCIVLKPTPRWDPQYVIPVVGMLLGNCINGVSLALNSILTSLVESSREIELLLSFGAGPYEATARLVRDAIRTGAMPLMNSMVVIGIISIPGMMTGQILGGTSVMQAARYQILIIYFICFSSFGMILMEIFLALQVMFDKRSILQLGLLTKRDKRPTFLAMVGGVCQSLRRVVSTGRMSSQRRLSTSFSTRSEEAKYLAPKGTLTVSASHEKGGSGMPPVLEVLGLSYGFETRQDEEGGLIASDRNTNTTYRLLFENLTFKLRDGEMALVLGPSGVGKSTLLHILAGLTDADADLVVLRGKSQDSYSVMPEWRKQVRYVPQTKVDIPGSPNDFMNKILAFTVWKNDGEGSSPSYAEIRSTARELVNKWGMSTSLLDSEWKTLSGGESQRMLVAISLASVPEGGVILLDESTSSLDVDTTLKVEETIKEHCRMRSIAAIWISHDPGQQDRMKATVNSL